MFPGMLEQVARLALALGAGVILGLEREWHEKTAGLRTITLVSIGSALFAMAAGAGFSASDRARIAAGIVTGIGFLGAGAILRERGEIRGLTTAAGVWVAAAVGMAAGFGSYWITIVGTAAAFVVLLAFPVLDRAVGRLGEDKRVYEVTLPYGPEQWPGLEQRFRDAGLTVEGVSLGRHDGRFTMVAETRGRPSEQRVFIRQLLDDPAFADVTIE